MKTITQYPISRSSTALILETDNNNSGAGCVETLELLYTGGVGVMEAGTATLGAVAVPQTFQWSCYLTQKFHS